MQLLYMILFGLLCLGCENTRQEDTADIDETASDTPRPIVSDEERQTDFNRRTEVSPPPSLPKGGSRCCGLVAGS